MWGTIISALASYIVPELLDQLDGSDYDNPYIERSLKALERRSKEGYGSDIISKMKQNINASYGSEGSALRAGTTQRLMRGNAPTQIREQVLRDLSASLSGKRMQALNSVDINNEEAKMRALSQMMGGSLQAKQDTGWSELQGSLLGSVFANAINKYSGSSGDLNTQKLLGASNNYYNNPSLGQSWAQNRNKWYGVK